MFSISDVLARSDIPVEIKNGAVLVTPYIPCHLEN